MALEWVETSTPHTIYEFDEWWYLRDTEDTEDTALAAVNRKRSSQVWNRYVGDPGQRWELTPEITSLEEAKAAALAIYLMNK